MPLSDSIQEQIRQHSKDDTSYSELVALFESQSRTESHYDFILKNVKDIVFQISRSGKWVFLSPAWEKVTGFSIAETLGQSFTDYVHPDDREAHYEIYRALVLHEIESCRHKVRYVHKTGEFRCFDVQARLTSDEEGDTSGAVGVFRDITDRERVEEALARSEVRYRQMFEGNRMVQFVFDPDTGRIVDANHAAAGFYGYSRDQLKTMRVQDINTLSEEEVSQGIARARSQHRSFFEFKHQLASGEIRDVDVFASPVRTADGDFIYSIIVDVTGKREAARRYQALFEQSNDAVFILDLKGNHIDANKRASEMLGYTQDELKSNSYRDIVVQEEHHQSDNVLQRLLDGGTIQPYERTFRRKDGSLLSTEINVEVVYDEHGKPLHVQSIVRDITERKQMEVANRSFLEDIKALQAIHLELSGVQSLDDLYQKVIKLAHQHLGIGRIGLFRLNKAGDQLLGTYGTDQHGVLRNEQYYTETITPDHWTLDILNANNHAKMWYEDDILDNSAVIGQGWKAAATLWTGERSLGYIVCDNYTTGRPPRDYEEELVSILGSTLGHVIDLKEMELANQAFLEDIKALQAVHMELSAVDNLDSLYQRIIELTRERLGIGRIGLFRVTRDGTEWYGTYGTDEQGNIQSEKQYSGIIEPDHWSFSILNAPNHALMWHEEMALNEWGEVRPVWKIASALWNGERSLGYIFCDNLLSGRPPRPYEEELISILGSTFGHIIDSKESEEALRESEERYRSVVSSMAEGVVLYDGDGNFQTCNPAVEKILGATAEEMAAYSHSELAQHVIHEDGTPFTPDEHPVAQTLKTGLPYSNVVMGVYRTDGERNWVSVNSQPLYYLSKPEERRPDAVLATFIDITDLKQAQQRKLELALERERVGMLTTFVQSAAHEFRTPLSTINSNAYLMSRLDDPESRGTRLAQVKMQIKRITKLVDMLLMMVKLESLSTLACLPVNIELTVNSLCQNVMSAYGDQLDIRYERKSNIPLVIGDPDYLADAIRQILDNAVRFTPEHGTITVTIGTENNRLWVDVEDTGPGISEEALPNIFETFWRQDQAHSTPGFGLGLPIARKIIERHGGQITVDSEVGAGTRFHITLPAMSQK